jgi:anion-transporting  ArsA/GET3 family ATPase
MILDELLSKRLLILSGKGGVGKSTVGIALALAACARAKRVLLVEVGASLEAARYLGARPAGAQATEVRPGLFTLNLDPAGVLDEYVRQVVKIQLLVHKILENPVYRRFVSAAPGLRELMVLGKLMVLEEARDRWSRRPLYDLIILDAPATGHGLSFLKVPLAASEAIPVGPVGHNARRILQLLRDPRRTALAIVATPEEMAVAEAVQFHRQVASEVGIAVSAVILNACHERRLDEAQETEVRRLMAQGAHGRLAGRVSLSAALRAGQRHIRRRKLTRFYQARLRKALDLPLVCLPYLHREELGPAEVRLLADRLEAS